MGERKLKHGDMLMFREGVQHMLNGGAVYWVGHGQLLRLGEHDFETKTPNAPESAWHPIFPGQQQYTVHDPQTKERN